LFIVEDPEGKRVPIKVWLAGPGELDPVCFTQAKNLARVPFVHKWVSLMPDTHQGYGMPIGGVVALKGVVIPNAVGVDIGCGVISMETELEAAQIDEAVGKRIIGKIMSRIPLGFKHHGEKQKSDALEIWIQERQTSLKQNFSLFKELEMVPFQLGTLGGGNHFIEIQRDESGRLCVMIHSGSRNFGKKIADYYNEKANGFAKKNGWQTHARDQLAFLPVDSEGGRAYLEWMTMALLFAQENRSRMMQVLEAILEEEFQDVRVVRVINAHHNYASEEVHDDQRVWVHRKGAIRVAYGELGIIPGAMGMESYIVRGRGNSESFFSCSHGAGRHISRRQAMKEISTDRVFEDLKERGVIVGTPDRAGLVDESRFVYKDINAVMEQQKDLVEPVKTLRSILVVKG